MKQLTIEAMVERVTEIIKERNDNSAVICHDFGVGYISINDVSCNDGIFELNYDHGELIIVSEEIESISESLTEFSDEEDEVIVFTLTILHRGKNITLELDF